MPFQLKPVQEVLRHYYTVKYHAFPNLQLAEPLNLTYFQPSTLEIHLDLLRARSADETWKFLQNLHNLLRWTQEWILWKDNKRLQKLSQTSGAIKNWLRHSSRTLPSPLLIYCSRIAENSSWPAVSRMSSLAGISSITTCFVYESSIVGS